MTRKELLALVNAYVAEHFKPKKPTDRYAASRTSSRRESIEHRAMMKFAVPSFLTRDFNVDDIVAKNAGETFSQMLLRLVKESDEKPSTIYKRADIDRSPPPNLQSNREQRQLSAEQRHRDCFCRCAPT